MCRIRIKTFLEQHYRLRCHMVLEERPTVLVVQTQNTTVTVSTFPFNTCAAQQQHGELLKSPQEPKACSKAPMCPQTCPHQLQKQRGPFCLFFSCCSFCTPRSALGTTTATKKIHLQSTCQELPVHRYRSYIRAGGIEDRYSQPGFPKD